MTSEPALPPVIGAIADDRDGRPLGTVTAVFVDDVTGEPTWVGLTDGTHAAPDAGDVALVAPIADARFADGRLRLDVPGEAVRSSPRPGAPDRLSPDEELTLQEHYAGARDRVGAADRYVDRDADVTTAGRVGDDGAMTRSEEQFTVESVIEPWTRAVLRIEEVTEEVMVPVTITRQQARIEYLPLRATDRASGGTDAGDRTTGRSTEWVTLYADQPVVTLERAPAERVRLTTTWLTDQMPVTDQLRREVIELTTDEPQR